MARRDALQNLGAAAAPNKPEASRPGASGIFDRSESPDSSPADVLARRSILGGPEPGNQAVRRTSCAGVLTRVIPGPEGAFALIEPSPTARPSFVNGPLSPCRARSGAPA